MLFLEGVRVSTLLLAVLLVATALWRRQPRGLVVVVAWFYGFEAAWEVTFDLVHAHQLVGGFGWIAGAGIGWTLLARAWGFQADGRLVLLTLAGWGLWLLLGFQANPAGGPVRSWGDELLNVGVKTSWGLAYLLPLWSSRRARGRRRRAPATRSPSRSRTAAVEA